MMMMMKIKRGGLALIGFAGLQQLAKAVLVKTYFNHHFCLDLKMLEGDEGVKIGADWSRAARRLLDPIKFSPSSSSQTFPAFGTQRPSVHKRGEGARRREEEEDPGRR